MNETEIYYGARREQNERDREKEEGLSRMWTEVAHQMHPINAEVARRCEAKKRYWADPIGWPGEELLRLKITLQEMHESLDRLLGGDDQND